MMYICVYCMCILYTVYVMYSTCSVIVLDAGMIDSFFGANSEDGANRSRAVIDSGRRKSLASGTPQQDLARLAAELPSCSPSRICSESELCPHGVFSQLIRRAFYWLRVVLCLIWLLGVSLLPLNTDKPTSLSVALFVLFGRSWTTSVFVT